jgi:hypothetical protein
MAEYVTTPTTEDVEKGGSSQLEKSDIDLDRVGELEGYVLDAQAGNASTRNLKTTKDGKTILIPQPSDDPNDPLNWSQTKKNIILGVVSATGMFLRSITPIYVQKLSHDAALLPDYGSATGAVTLIPQAA